MTKFCITVDATTSFSGGNAPQLDVIVDGINASLSMSSGSGSYTFWLEFDDLLSLPTSIDFTFNGGSGDLGDSINITNVLINGQRIDTAADLTGTMLTQSQTESISNITKQEYLLGRTEPTLAELGTITKEGTALDDDIWQDTTAGVDDVIDGQAGSDRIQGLDGEDAINGGDGDDFLYGQDGNDIVIGGIGNDNIFGGAGDDLLHGQDGNDYLTGGDGNDVMSGGLGDDGLLGDAGDDIMFGESGSDWLIGNDGNDTMYGDAGIDYLVGAADDDTMYGGADDDYMYGNTGNDTMYGDAGLDFITGGDGNDIIDGGADDDEIHGDAGDDTIDGGSGNDVLIGGEGADTLIAGGGNDTLNGQNGLDDLYGGAGRDVFLFESASAFNNIDTINNFDAAGRDALDVSDILVSAGYDPIADSITDWLEIIDSKAGSELRVDTSGKANFGAGTLISTIVGVTGLTDEQSLETNGNLITS